MPHDPNDTDGSSQSGHHTLGPRRNQATPGNHRHIIGTPEEGYISETLFDPDVDVINGSFSGTAVPQLLAILKKYGLEVDASAILPSAQWLWDESTDTTTAPAVGYVRGNAALLENNTELAINRTSQDGKFIPDNTIQSGDAVILVGNTVASVYEVVTATQNTDWIFLTVNHTQGSGNPVQDEPITIGLYGGSSGHDHPQYLEPDEVLAGQGITVIDNGDGTITIISDVTGTSDHGSLTGLQDDDHPQYLLPAEVVAGSNVNIQYDTPSPGFITINATGGGGGDVEETYYGPEPPALPNVADVWMDSDGVAAYPQTHPVPTGAIMYFPSLTLPDGWILCDGRAVDRTLYGALFLICGTTFGAGDGVTTFNVPNLAGKFAHGGNPGSVGGSDTHFHPGTNWRTGFTSVGNTDNTNVGGTNDSDAAPNGTGETGNHTHGGGTTGLTSISHSHGISSDGSHNHGGTGTQSGTYGASGGGTGVTKSHSHSISSAGGHNHGGTGSAGGSHNHPVGTTGSHSHGVPGSNHSHGIAGSNHNHVIAGRNHDHSVPNSTPESNLPPYLNLAAMIYSGVHNV